jgi:outer membrane protein
MKNLSKLLVAIPAIVLSPVLSGKSHAADQPYVVVSTGVGLAPEFEGSRDHRAIPLFLVHAGWSGGRFIALDMGGLSANFIEGARWQAGPVARYRVPRRDVEDRRVAKLPDVDGAVEVGAFVALAAGPYGVKLSALHDVAGAHDGTLVEVEGTYALALGEKSSMAFSVSANYADAAYMNTYFSINGENARRSGLERFDADAGLKDFGVGVICSRELSESWGVSAAVKYTRLLADAGDSPIVTEAGDPDQLIFALFTRYSF